MPSLTWHPWRGAGSAIRRTMKGRVCQTPRRYYFYILASKRNGTLYCGVTNDLLRRVWEHKQGIHEGFTKKYGVHDLVYFEDTDRIDVAIYREKQIKAWKRQWKLELIETMNPEWRDLYDELLGR